MSIIVNKVMGNGVAQQVTEVPSTADLGILNVTASNLSETETHNIEIFIGTGTLPSNVDNVEPRGTIPALGHYELNCRSLAPNEKVWVIADAEVCVRTELLLQSAN